MPENPLEVDTHLKQVFDVVRLDTNEDGNPDGLCTVVYHTLYDVPYPSGPSNDLAGFEPLGPREREVIEGIGTIAERADVEILRIRAHASGEGTPDDNDALSQRRLDATIQAIVELRTADPSRDIRIAADAELLALGESEPEIFAGEQDHPVNRRIVIAFRVTRIARSAIDPADPPGRKWKIGYDIGVSLYRGVGAQIRFGTLSRLDDADQPVATRKFWHLGVGVGYEVGGRLAKAATKARQKQAGNHPLNADDHGVLARRGSRRGDEEARQARSPGFAAFVEKFRNGWKPVTDTLDHLGLDENFANATPEIKTVQLLDALGLSNVIPSAELYHGTFETSTPRTMAELELSVSSFSGQRQHSAVGGARGVLAHRRRDVHRRSGPV